MGVECALEQSQTTASTLSDSEKIPDLLTVAWRFDLEIAFELLSLIQSGTGCLYVSWVLSEIRGILGVMKTAQAWRLGMGDMQNLPGPRHRPPLKRPLWIIVLVSLISFFIIGAYVYPPQSNAACYILSPRGCKGISEWLPPVPTREYTDEEIAARVVTREILNAPPIQSESPKVAFMFLTPSSLPLKSCGISFSMSCEWSNMGHEGKFSVYVHASKEKPVHVSRYFVNRDVRSDQVVWGKISMVDAERRLLADALHDPDNQHFVLLSESCVPLYSFDYIYNHLINTNISFVDSFQDPGPHGNGRYSEHMLPEIEKKDFRKGAQWFSMKRQHAVVVLADYLYYSKFRDYCKPGLEGRNCIADEHYLPTFFQLIDPGGIANWSVTHVDWSERKWHPKSYKANDVTYGLLKNITSISESVHVTSDAKKEVQRWPCLWNGMQRPCYLFARKFLPEALDSLLYHFANYTTTF
ncbi:hypothetical protein FNV43_RR03153 [Rhamnella rubrinervis]|uniref:Core-2/I-branching beta-1,6-N-acetylglucosaminyltransferase family protein n=1 Tax=Rhamnella rubrinervis TaxID=2594499 RepID=A0A8K0MPB7_9ROSA|nr:hypothetical protein FNV43_RR03153 [Rhamnella rubrinervis]